VTLDEVPPYLCDLVLTWLHLQRAHFHQDLELALYYVILGATVQPTTGHMSPLPPHRELCRVARTKVKEIMTAPRLHSPWR
jgi:hypothetical protein